MPVVDGCQLQGVMRGMVRGELPRRYQGLITRLTLMNRLYNGFMSIPGKSLHFV
jgi:hypothetical protein